MSQLVEGNTHEQRMNNLAIRENSIRQDTLNWEAALRDQATTHAARVKQKKADIENREKSIRAIEMQIEKLVKFSGQVTMISRETSNASEQLRKSFQKIQEVKTKW